MNLTYFNSLLACRRSPLIAPLRKFGMFQLTFSVPPLPSIASLHKFDILQLSFSMPPLPGMPGFGSFAQLQQLGPLNYPNSRIKSS
jgi:hypothetical protein